MKPMKLNLQYFADPNTSDDGDNGKKTPKTYDQADIDKMMAAQGRKLKEQFTADQSSHDEELKAKYLKEGEDRAQMSADEKAAAQIDDERKKNAADAKANAEKAAELDHKADLSATRKLLTSQGLPVSFAESLVDHDESKRVENVKGFADKMSKAVDAEIANRAKGKRTPQGGNSGPAQVSGEVTKEAFNAMSVGEQTSLYHKDKELYKKLRGSK